MNSKSSISQVELVAQKNDAARSNAANYIATKGIMSLDAMTICDVFLGVQDYTNFNEDNDPYGTHDFGSFEVRGHKVFWKIDYYNQDLTEGRKPLDPDCRRVVTIMLAEEY